MGTMKAKVVDIYNKRHHDWVVLLKSNFDSYKGSLPTTTSIYLAQCSFTLIPQMAWTATFCLGSGSFDVTVSVTMRSCHDMVVNL